MDDFFLNLGFSWTLSKIIPYFLCVVLGLGIFYSFKSKLKKRWTKLLFSLVILLPFGIYFIFNPIYEGDFSNDYREISTDSSYKLKRNELTVIAIPNCPYCAESIERLNKLAERSDIRRINFIVITEDREMLKLYKGKASKKIKISKTSDYERFADLTLGKFPTFVYASSPNFHLWSNDVFGVRALDWIESQVPAK